MKPTFILPIAIVIGGFIIATAVYVSISAREPSTSSRYGDPVFVRPVGTQDHVFGNPTAPVKIVEYANFDCKFCKEFNNTLRQIIVNDGTHGKVAWIYREFPLTKTNPNSFRNAEAAECASSAGGNGAFWRFANILFQNQPINQTQYGVFAAQAKVPSSAFASCMSTASTTIQDRIKADRENALASGAHTAPYSLILVEGQPPIVIDGAYSYNTIKQFIDMALQISKKSTLSSQN